MKVVVVGATGFVGRALLVRLLEQKEVEVTALSRNPIRVEHPEAKTRLTSIACDLHNLREIEQALDGQDVAIYLVHSMLPSARLNQGTFADFDLILADNFARAARLKGINHVIYLSGLIPEQTKLSEHLRSRLEVENTLKAYIPKVTVLRAGIIIGEGGSSFTILTTLVWRLPVMLCPVWTRNLCQVIGLDDVLRVITKCLLQEEWQGQTWDIGAEPPLSYLDMLKKTAEIFHLKRFFRTVPLMSLGISKLWVRLVSGAPKDLVYPLIDSLKTSMLVRPSHRFPHYDVPPVDFIAAVKSISPKIENHGPALPHAYIMRASAAKQNYVRSIQRLELPPGKDAAWVAQEYMRYLPKFLPFILRVETHGQSVHLKIAGVGWDLLVLRHAPERSRPDRQLFYIVGGLLNRPSRLKARLEMREALNGSACLIAVHDYYPSLPWLLYRCTQAQAHKIFMTSLDRYLHRS